MTMLTAAEWQKILGRLPQIYNEIADLLEDYRAVESEQKAYARLARQVGRLMALWGQGMPDAGSTDEVLEHVNAAYQAILNPCTCQPPGSGGDACTGHCYGRERE